MSRLTKILTYTFIALMIFSGVRTPVSALPKDQKAVYERGINWHEVACNSASCMCLETSGTVSTKLPDSIPANYRTLLSAAASKYNINPQYLAALFLNENGNVWKPFNTNWQSSHSGASGPFQFMPGTWEGYKVDGNNDGKADINDMYDSAYAAANYLKSMGIKEDTELGSIDKPFKPGTFLYFSAAYNWGPGNVQSHTTSSSPITASPVETQNYIKNSYELIKSSFTKGGHANYGDPRSDTDGSSDSGSNTVSETSAGGCSGSVVAGDIVQTALNLAWNTGGHGKEKSDAKSSYQEAMPQYNGSTGTDEWSDCGVFVATVMIASGADKDYPKRVTTVQQTYLDNHPEKYDNRGQPQSTDDLKPGDILVNSSHTYMYVGPQTNTDNPNSKYNSVGASLHGHVPQATNFYGGFTAYRLK